MSGIACDPLLKWAGGKRRFVQEISAIAPAQIGRYYEPFLGGGALFFSLLPANATLSDFNDELINAYIQLRDDPGEVVRRLRKMPNTERDYYRIRQWEPRNTAARAARLLYLCTLSFNGIYRQNLHGKFNVPYGRKTHVIPCDERRLRLVSDNLQGREIMAADFEQAVASAAKGDLVYFDPPYTVAHGNNGFIKYNATIFSWADQVRLASVALKLKTLGVHVIISNAHHHSILQLYTQFSVKVITRHSVMAASGDFRRPVEECLFF